MIRFFASHPTAANLLMLALLLAGARTLPELRRETMPDFAAQEVEVSVLYPGATAEEIESAICLRLEDALDGISDVEEIRCEAREGVGTAVVRMTEAGDIDRFTQEVRTEVEAVDSLPQRAEAPVIRQLGRTDRVVSVAVAGPMDTVSLKAWAEQLKDGLQALPEVSLVEVQGFSDHHLRVHASAGKLRQYGLSVADLADAVARQSVGLPAGVIETRDRDLLLRFDDERRDVRALEDLVVIAGGSGAVIRLGEVATVHDRFDLEEERVVFDGQRAAVLAVTKSKDEDALEVVAAVKRFVREARARAPPQVQIRLTQDVASVVEDRLSMLTRNGVQGLVLVFLVMWLFFPLRLSFWVAAGLPVSFLGGLWLMGAIGYSINMITMVALLIALGLLMDDAIVISENVATHLRRGKGALVAAVDGTREVAAGVLSSFLTTCAVFGPLAFISGDIGKVLKVLPVVLILVLAVSLVEAFLILPRHLAHSFARGGEGAPSRLRAGIERGLEWTRQRLLGWAVDAAVRWRHAFLAAVVALFALSVAMVASGRLGFQAFPDIDGDVVEARLLLPQGTPLARTEAVVHEVTEALERVNRELSPGEVQGGPLVRGVSVRYARNPDAPTPGPHVATVSADLVTAEHRRARIDAIVARWRKEVGLPADVVDLSFKDPQLGPAGRALDVRLTGTSLAELHAASRELVAWLRRYQGVHDVAADLRPGKPEQRVRLRPEALALGLDAALIAGQLRAAFLGTTAYEVQVGTEALEIDVRLAPGDRDALEDLHAFRVTLPDGRLVPLVAVATLDEDRGVSRINRIDRRRTVTVRGDVDVRVANALAVIEDTRQRFLPDFEARFPAITVSFEGQAREGGETGASVRNAFLLGLVGVFLLLSFQFRSYLEPLVVMAVIPLALVGVIWGHLLLGLDLSMPSVMGFVSLSGIVVNDSILLVTFLKRRVAEGMSVHDAAARASRERFRAVLLTSLTTIAGLLPLLAERSLQAQVLVPLVASIAFGLMATTVLVLLLVPALYAVLDDHGLAAPGGAPGLAAPAGDA